MHVTNTLAARISAHKSGAAGSSGCWTVFLQTSGPLMSFQFKLNGNLNKCTDRPYSSNNDESTEVLFD